VVGLGNPGPRYERTRHNAGFMAIDELAARTRAAGRLVEGAWMADATLAGEPALLVKPQTFMNLSGAPVARLLFEHASSPADLVVVVDDVALPLGRLRVRERGSDGGHNGLRSLVASLDSVDFPRVRIGVGLPDAPVEPEATVGLEPPRVDLADYVLGDFTAAEIPTLREVVRLAADAVTCLVQEGPAAAMNRFNGLRA
jgi:PTH1 family peptidyl-tRNA hydrolase